MEKMEEEEEEKGTTHPAARAKPKPKPSHQQEVKKERESEKKAASGSKQGGRKGEVKNPTATVYWIEQKGNGIIIKAGKLLGVLYVLALGLAGLAFYFGESSMPMPHPELEFKAVAMYLLQILNSPELSFMNRLLLLYMFMGGFVTGLGLGLAPAYYWLNPKAAAGETEVFALVETIVGRLREQHKASLKSDGSIPNNLAVNDLRDQLLNPEEERASELDLWTKVVDHIKLNERSRIGEEIEQVDGVELQVWKWLPDSTATATAATTHPKAD